MIRVTIPCAFDCILVMILLTVAIVAMIMMTEFVMVVVRIFS